MESVEIGILHRPREASERAWEPLDIPTSVPTKSGLLSTMHLFIQPHTHSGRRRRPSASSIQQFASGPSLGKRFCSRIGPPA